MNKKIKSLALLLALTTATTQPMLQAIKNACYGKAVSESRGLGLKKFFVPQIQRYMPQFLQTTVNKHPYLVAVGAFAFACGIGFSAYFYIRSQIRSQKKEWADRQVKAAAAVHGVHQLFTDKNLEAMQEAITKTKESADKNLFADVLAYKENKMRKPFLQLLAEYHAHKNEYALVCAEIMELYKPGTKAEILRKKAQEEEQMQQARKDEEEMQRVRKQVLEEMRKEDEARAQRARTRKINDAVLALADLIKDDKQQDAAQLIDKLQKEGLFDEVLNDGKDSNDKPFLQRIATAYSKSYPIRLTTALIIMELYEPGYIKKAQEVEAKYDQEEEARQKEAARNDAIRNAVKYIQKLFYDRDLKDMRNYIQGLKDNADKNENLLEAVKNLDQDLEGKPSLRRLAEHHQNREEYALVAAEIMEFYVPGAKVIAQRKIDVQEAIYAFGRAHDNLDETKKIIAELQGNGLLEDVLKWQSGHSKPYLMLNAEKQETETQRMIMQLYADLKIS